MHFWWEGNSTGSMEMSTVVRWGGRGERKGNQWGKGKKHRRQKRGENGGEREGEEERKVEGKEQIGKRWGGNKYTLG